MTAPKAKRFIIYGLVDPRNAQLRYVGKSCVGLSYRLNRHWADRHTKSRKSNWLLQLEKTNLRPETVIIQEFDSADILADAEIHWIRYFIEMGFRLVNGTGGGDGAMGRVWTPESRRRAAEAQRGKRASEATKLKMSLARKNRIHSPETRVKLSRAMGIRPFVDNLGRSYDSLKGAARELGLWPNSIRQVLKGRLKSTGGFTFRWKE